MCWVSLHWRGLLLAGRHGSGYGRNDNKIIQPQLPRRYLNSLGAAHPCFESPFNKHAMDNKIQHSPNTCAPTASSGPAFLAQRTYSAGPCRQGGLRGASSPAGVWSLQNSPLRGRAVWPRAWVTWPQPLWPRPWCRVACVGGGGRNHASSPSQVARAAWPGGSGRNQVAATMRGNLHANTPQSASLGGREWPQPGGRNHGEGGGGQAMHTCSSALSPGSLCGRASMPACRAWLSSGASVSAPCARGPRVPPHPRCGPTCAWDPQCLACKGGARR